MAHENIQKLAINKIIKIYILDIIRCKYYLFENIIIIIIKYEYRNYMHFFFFFSQLLFREGEINP